MKSFNWSYFFWSTLICGIINGLLVYFLIDFEPTMYFTGIMLYTIIVNACLSVDEGK